MRNEAIHIMDWLKFHAIAGVRDFYIYDDGSTDETVELAQSVAGLNVTVIPWRVSASLRKPEVYFSRQVLAYCHAIENFGGAFRWMAFIDADEFLFPKKTATILDALTHLECHSTISIPWTMFGPGEHDVAPSLPAPYAYTYRAASRAKPILNFKCIVDPAEVLEVRVHSFTTLSMGATSANDVGAVISKKKRHSPSFISDESLRLNHYYTRSREELRLKLSRGAVSDSPRDRRAIEIFEKLQLIERTAVQDDSALEFLQRHGIDDACEFRELHFGPVAQGISSRRLPHIIP